MTRGTLTKMLGSLALLGPLAAPAWAEEKPGQTVPQSIYSTEEVIQHAVQERAPEQAVPKSTEGKGVQDAPASEEAKTEEPVNFLMDQLRCTHIGPWLECNGIKVSGWMAQGATWNPDSPDNRFNFPTTFNDRSNEYQLNQFYLAIERAVKTDGCCWDFGGRIDLLYGTDYYFTTSVGWETEPDGTQGWNSEDGPRFQFGAARLYGLAVPQLYAEVYAPIGNGIDIKLGHFYTPVGYETVTSTGNFFYSHSFTHQYFEPFTHWGVIANTNLDDSIKVGAGIVMGWDVLDDLSDKLSVVGTIAWTSCDKNTTLFYGVIAGEEAGLIKENGRVYQSIILTHKLCENLTSVTGTDLIFQNDGSFTIAVEEEAVAADAEAYSIYQYLLYDINKCLSAGMRVEVSRDDDNLRIIPAGGLAEGATFTSLTLGLNWKPFENMRVRPELRWDWTDFNFGPFSAFDDASDNNQFTAALDVILTY